MRVFRLIGPAIAAVSLAHAQPSTFERHAFPDSPFDMRGAALDGDRLIAWGDALLEWMLPREKPRILARAPFQEGGCLADLDGDGKIDFVSQEGPGLGALVWRQALRRRPQPIDTGIEMHDCLGATLFGRRGLLMVHRYGQVRFYEHPKAPGSARWPYREIYSFYTASRQAGLLLQDVDGDGLPDILCGNYWIRSPKTFEEPWRLFAINIDHETPVAASARFAWLDAQSRQLAVSQGHKANAKLSVFRRPAQPTDLWDEQRLNAENFLVYPHGLDTGDLDGDGDRDIAVAENGIRDSRVLVVWNLGGGNFRAEKIGDGVPFHTVRIPRAGELLTIGKRSVVRWRSPYRLRK